MSAPEPSFGDNVRIRTCSETEAAGVAGLTGQVYGETTPSITGVSVIGGASKDRALNVFFKGRNESFWFAPELVEFVDHAPGTEVRLHGVDKKWVRQPTGEWDERPATTRRAGLLQRLAEILRWGK